MSLEKKLNLISRNINRTAHSQPLVLFSSPERKTPTLRGEESEFD